MTDQGPEVGVTTARLLLEHAIAKDEQKDEDEDPDLARLRAIKAHTGAAVFLPPKVISQDKPDTESASSKTYGTTGA